MRRRLNLNRRSINLIPLHSRTHYSLADWQVNAVTDINEVD
jgi:hypothetical protein